VRNEPAATRAPQLPVRDWLRATRERRPARLGDADAFDSEPAVELVTNEVLRQETIRYTTQLLVAERCSLAAAAGLINATAAVPWKLALATQVLDEARHVEMFTERLAGMGIAREALESTVVEHAHPDLLGLSEVVLRPVQAGDFLGGVLAQGLVLDEILTATYELLQVFVSPLEPAFAEALAGILDDERRHTGFADSVVATLVVRGPERKLDLDRMQREIGGLMLKTFDAAFRDNPMADELRRVLRGRNGRAVATFAGIDPIGSDPIAVAAALERLIVKRMRHRFRRLGIGYRAPAGTPKET
jgi:hypothetical protein